MTEFPLAGTLRSTDSARSLPAFTYRSRLFVGFFATMIPSDFRRPYTRGVRSQTSPRRTDDRQSSAGSPDLPGSAQNAYVHALGL